MRVHMVGFNQGIKRFAISFERNPSKLSQSQNNALA